MSLYALSCGWLFNTDACHLLHVRSPLPQRGWQPQAPHGPWGQECVVLHTAAARCGPTQHGTRFLPCHLGLCLACSSLHSGFCPLGFNADYGSSWQPLGPGGHLFPSSGRSSAVPPPSLLTAAVLGPLSSAPPGGVPVQKSFRPQACQLSFSCAQGFLPHLLRRRY